MYLFFTSLCTGLFFQVYPTSSAGMYLLFVFNKNLMRKKKTKKHPRTFVRRKSRWKDAGERLERSARSAAKNKRIITKIKIKKNNKAPTSLWVQSLVKTLESWREEKGTVARTHPPCSCLFFGSSSSAPSRTHRDPPGALSRLRLLLAGGSCLRDTATLTGLNHVTAFLAELLT